MVKHVILWKLKDDVVNKAAAKRGIKDGLEGLNGKIPGLVDIAALAELPPTLREAFTLFQIDELSVREIARQTNVTEANVKVRIHRAKERLRERLKG